MQASAISQAREPNRSNPEGAIAVLFSGGSDSTLAAVIAAERAERVHLVTYLHPFMLFHGKIDINVARLREKYGADTFVVHRENITRLYRGLYTNGLVRLALRQGTMLLPHMCGACKLAMHFATARYCLRHGISRVFCGAHEESSRVFPAQMRPVIEDTKRMYERHGIVYETPVYEAGRTDSTLYDLGLIDDPRMKDQHLFYSTQHTCPVGALVHIHSRLYYTKLWGHDEYEKRSQLMVRELLERTEHDVLRALLERTDQRHLGELPNERTGPQQR